MKPQRPKRPPRAAYPVPAAVARPPLEHGEHSGLCLIHGRQPVLEVLRLGLVKSLEMSRMAHGRSVDEIRRLAAAAAIPMRQVDSFEASEGLTVQGVRAWAESPPVRFDLRPFLADLPESPAPLILILDGIQDPQNFGAIIRTAETAAVSAIIVRERRQAPLTDVVVKVSAGSAYLVPIFQVVNISQSLKILADFGFWSVATVADPQAQTYTQYDWSGKTAIIVGAEGAGVSDLVLRQADAVVTIPLFGRTESLNVAAAAAVILFEAAKSRFPHPQPSRTKSNRS